jgi:pimeloyl-ACP methyl ester carboxylesterase
LILAEYPAARTGIEIGVSDVQKRLEQQVKDCPNEKFALAGYSQGGRVVTMATAKLPPELAQKVLAVVLYGAGNGTAIQGLLKDRTLANCAPGDPVSPLDRMNFQV